MISDTEESSDDHSKSYQNTRSAIQRPIHSMHRSPDRKVCYFYKDGDINFGGVKVAVNPRIYPGIESLHSELTSKLNDLPFGVRSIYTPRGRTCIHDVSDLANEGRYVCSTYKHLARGLDISRVSRERAWNFAARPPSGKRAFNDLLREKPARTSRVTPRQQVWATESDHVLYRHSKMPKKIIVSVSGEPGRAQTLLLYRRTMQTFEQVLQDLSEMFEMPVKKMFTMDGRMVKSLSAIYTGPERYVITSGEQPLEPWKFPDSEVVYEPPEKRNKEWRSAPTKTRAAKKSRTSKTKGRFNVTVITGDSEFAGTSAQVGITVYGRRGDSGLIPLGNADGVIFQHRNVDEFEISVGDIGEIYKVRISHDDSGDFPEWFCSQIRLEDVHTKEEFLFNCGRWLSRDKEDGEICREIPISHNGRHIHPIVVYEVTVVTGDLWNARTDANVYLTIYGERGDTGVRHLHRSTERDKFRMGQSDVFSVEAVSLGVLTRVVVGHDGTGSGRGWFLDQIIIKDHERAKSSWIFPCRRWLDEGEDDGKIVRELSLHDNQSDEKYKQELIDRVMWKFQSRAHVILYSKLTERPLRIHSDGVIYLNEEEEDDCGVFVVLCKRSNYKIFQNMANPNFHLALDNNGLIVENKKSDCDEFIVRVQSDRSVLFESVKFRNRYISSGNTAGKPTELSKHFFVYCKGAFHDGGIVIFWTSVCQTLTVEESLLRATGRRVRSAQFCVHKVKDKGVRMFESLHFPNQFIRIRDNNQCDVMGTGDRYCEFQVHRMKSKDYVELESVACRGLFVGMTPEGDVRPTVANDSKNVRFYPEIVEQKKSKNDGPLPPVVKKKQMRQNQPSPDRMIIQREQSEFDDSDWKVWVSTAETATNAGVGLVVYGEKSNSGMIIIGSSGSKTLFQADNTDEFKINLENVGKIYKVRVELIPENSKMPASMKLKEVRLQHLVTKEMLKFRCNRWLSRHQDDLDIVRELPAVRPNQPVLPVMKYRVETYTGSLPGSDTEANVFVNLFGERGDMGKRLLFRSNNDIKFAEGQVDRFEFEAVSLGVLTQCLVSHDGFGAGDGWFCQKVVVTETPTNIKYTFPCDMWLDSSIDDGRIERLLKVKDENAIKESPEKPKPGDWLLTTVTGNQSDEKMEDMVVIFVYGDKGFVGPVELRNETDGKAFGKGKTGEFKVNFGVNLGSLYKVRIGLKEENDHDITSNWFLQKLKMKSLSGQREILSLDVNQWMSRRMNDCSIWREVAVSGPGKRPLPLIAYQVEVYTGSLKGSETSATVFVQMFGSRGDSGKRRLFRSQNDVKFQAGRMDAFEIQAVSLDEIRNIVIGHRCHEKGGGWYLEKVIVREGSARVFHLPCRRWLDAGMEDGAIERTLFPKEPSANDEKPVGSVESASPRSPETSLREGSPPPQSEGSFCRCTKWKISVSHRLKDDAKSVKKPYSPDGVIVVFYGKIGVSEELVLTNGTAEKQDNNKKEEYISQSYERSVNHELGELYKIRIGLRLDENKMLPNIFVHQMKLQNMKSLKEYTFDIDASIAEKAALTGWVEVPFGGKLSVLTYVVEVYTGDVRFAGTNANVHLMIVGERGDTGRRQLRQSLSTKKDKFEAGNVDVFEIEAVDLMKPVRVVVGHDGKGPGSGWFLDKVLVHCKNKDIHGSKYLFKCRRWLDEDEGDRLTERVLELSDDVVGTKSDSIPVSDVTETDNKDIWKIYAKTGVFKHGGDDDDEEDDDYDDDGNTNNNANGEQEQQIRADFERRRKKKLRSLPRAPTEELLLVVYGTRGKTEELPLEPVNPNDGRAFSLGHLDEFRVKFPKNLGDIYKVRIGFSNDNGGDQNWFLETLLLEDADSGEKYLFEVNGRLLRDRESDGWTEIPLSEGAVHANGDNKSSQRTLRKRPLPVLKYTIEVYTGSRSNASAGAKVYMMLVGERGDSGKRQLIRSFSTEDEPFKQNQRDVFEIMAVDLLDIKKVIVGHDGKGKGQRWFLDRVVVEVSSDNKENIYRLDCNGWLNDEFIERELLVAEDIDDLWTVSVATGSYEDDREIGRVGRRPFGHQMIIVVYGDKDKTPDLDLRPVDEDEDDDDDGKREEIKFTVQFADKSLGKVYKVRIGCNDRKRETEEYFPKTVLLQNRVKRKSYRFEFEDKLIWKELFDGWWEIPVTQDDKSSTSVNSKAGSSLSVIRYEVELYTACRDSSSAISDVYLTLSGERGDTGRRNLLKPIHTEPLEFPNPVLLADEQQRFRQKHSNGGRQSKSFKSTDSLIPPLRKKSEIISLTDFEEIDRHAKTAPMDLAAKSYDALVSYLMKPAKNEIDHIRAIFAWITSQRLHDALDFTNGDLPPPKTPLHDLLSVLIQRSFNGYSELLCEMCSCAKIPCKVIKGRVKGVGCWPGKRRTGTNDYCIVFVEGSWRFVDPHWGSICCQPQSLCRPGAPPPPKFDSVLRPGNRRDAPEDSDINGCGYVSDDFYFLTDPEVFIYTHMSCDPSLQLLSRPVGEEEFWEMAYLREAFFRLEMTSVSHPKCVVKANKDGRVVLEFGLSRSRSCHFAYELSKSSVDPSLNAVDGASLNRFVTMENTGKTLTIAIRFPAIGRYKFELYGRDVREGESVFTAVCEYAIVCRIPDFEAEPNPVNPRSEWGPGADARTLGLKPVEPLGGGTLRAENGEAKVRFRMMKSKSLVLHGIVKNDKEILTDVVCSFRTENEFVFLLKLSRSGTFLFQIFSMETKGSASTTNICNYLVKSDRNLSKVKNFFPIDDKMFSIGDQTTESSELRLRSISHEYPVIDPLNENTLDITMSASSRDFDLRIRLERFAHRGADAEDLSKYSYLRQNKEILHISLVFPKFGFYKLSIFTDKNLLYVYLVNVKNSDGACSPFPVQSPNWKPQFAILKPRTGNLKANTEYLFRIKAKDAEPVSIEADGSESKSLRSEGSDVWEGSLKTLAEGGGTLRIIARTQLLLTYKVQSANEMLRKKQKQEAAVSAELSHVKKMEATDSGQLKEDPQKKKTEEVDEKKKEFRANQGKYEKQEALMQWREEEAAEKFLFHGIQNRPITKSKKFSNEVFGMAIKRSVFCLAAVDLLDIRGVLVGHTKQKIGDGWFLEKVVVHSWSDVGLNTCVFPCHRWLEKGLEDGKTERELREEKLPNEEGTWWSVTAVTGDPKKFPDSKDTSKDPGRSKKSKPMSASLLRLVVYGSLGKTEDLPMTLVDPSDPNAFSKGHSDEFKVKIDDVGDVFKIRIGFDDRSTSADDHSWLIDTVTLQEPKSSRTQFIFRKYLRKDKDCDGWLEAAVNPTAAAQTECAFFDQVNLRPASVCVYRIEVYNDENHDDDDDDDDVSAETELFVCLVGEKGDSGMRKLLKSRKIQSSSSKQMDVYEIKVVDLVDVRKVIVGHGAKGRERFLEKIVVKTSDKNNAKESAFSYGRTLENGQTEVSLLRDDLRPVVVTTDRQSVVADDDKLQEISDIGEEERKGEDDSQEEY